MKMGAAAGNPAPVRSAKNAHVETCGNALRLGLEVRDSKRRCAAAQCVAGCVVDESLLVLLLLLKCAPARKVQLSLVAVVPGRTCEQFLHRSDLGVTKHVGLQIREAPVGLTETRIHPQALVIGLLALVTPAQGFMDMADRETQSDLCRIEARRFFKGRKQGMTQAAPRER